MLIMMALTLVQWYIDYSHPIQTTYLLSTGMLVILNCYSNSDPHRHPALKMRDLENQNKHKNRSVFVYFCFWIPDQVWNDDRNWVSMLVPWYNGVK